MTKSLGLLSRRKETEEAGEREGSVREQLREDEHEYVGLVLHAREDEGRRERRGARERDR